MRHSISNIIMVIDIDMANISIDISLISAENFNLIFRLISSKYQPHIGQMNANAMTQATVCSPLVKFSSRSSCVTQSCRVK